MRRFMAEGRGIEIVRDLPRGPGGGLNILRLIVLKFREVRSWERVDLYLSYK